MFECISMFCVMIAAKHQSVNSSLSSSQNHQQKSNKNQHHLNPQREAATGEKNETRSEKRATISLSADHAPACQYSPSKTTTKQRNNEMQVITNKNNLIIGGSNLPTASAKIQQKQQKFLAAAAKSATSPPPPQTEAVVASATSATSVSKKRPPAAVITSNNLQQQREQCKPSPSIDVYCCQPAANSGMTPSGACSSHSTTTSAAVSSLQQMSTLSASASSSYASAPLSCKQEQQSRPAVPATKVLPVKTSAAAAAAVAASSSSSTPILIENSNHVDSKVDSSRQQQQQDIVGSETVGHEARADKEENKNDRVEVVEYDKSQCSVVAPVTTGDIGDNTSPSSSNLLQNFHRHQNNLLSSTNNNNNNNNYHKHHQQNIHNYLNHNINNHHHHQHHHHHHNHHQHHQTTITSTQQQQQPLHPNHHYHHQQQQQPQQQQQHPHNQQPQQHTMAHYKFHNDCQSSVLTYEQVKRLDFVMDQTVPIHGRGNFPTLYVKLKELIRLVKYKLQKEHSIEIRDVRLNGGAASYVLAPENSHYNDLDLIFGTDLSDEDQFDVIRDVVLECLKEFFPKDQQHQEEGGHHFNGMADDNDNFINEFSPRPTTIMNAVDGNITLDNKETNNDLVENSRKMNRSMSCDSDNLKIIINESDDDDSEGDNDDNGDENDDHDAGEGRNESVGEIRETREKMEKHHTGSEGVNAVDERRSAGLSNMAEMQSGHAARMKQNFQYQQSYQMPLSNCAIKEAYVHKMVKVNDDDRWSLISLGVQQSEANCCGQTNCSASTMQMSNQRIGAISRHQQQFAVTLANNENEPKGLISQSSTQMVSNENSTPQAIVTNSTQHHQATYLLHQDPNQRNHYQHQQQKQFPNSIELKFVDRMRRKFEFSVDSFQIILDSLIQFYDYAPQSTITSQRKLINSHPSSTMINTRPLVNKRSCTDCCNNRAVLENCKTDNNSGSLSKANVNRENYNHRHNHQTLNGFTGTNKQCASLLNSSRSYYQLPIEPANSPSISSVASSSGCSSSSSVVSSSSSSLSCDEDHEDLYCDADSPSSSSASTSSLLSSTTLSTLSSDSPCNDADLLPQQKSNQLEDRQTKTSTKQVQRNQSNKRDSKGDTSSRNSASKMKSVQETTTVDTISTSKTASRDCVECFGEQQNLINNVYDFDTNNRTSCAVISENFYPTVIGRSEYGNFKEALYHLEKKLIATRSPEEIRGGGLLKYCNLLVKNYKPTNVYQIRTLERYMCSRFFIDFSDLNQQQAKLESYLANHFSDDPILKFDYLTILHNVVQRSTVCLMNHELRLTLTMIRDLAYKLNEQQQQQHQQSQLQNQQLVAQQHQMQQSSQAQAQQQHYYQQKPVLIQSGVYRVKLVNYTLAKPLVLEVGYWGIIASVPPVANGQRIICLWMKI